jgi:hypothetical protein
MTGNWSVGDFLPAKMRSGSGPECSPYVFSRFLVRFLPSSKEEAVVIKRRKQVVIARNLECLIVNWLVWIREYSISSPF